MDFRVDATPLCGPYKEESMLNAVEHPSAMAFSR